MKHSWTRSMSLSALLLFTVVLVACGPQMATPTAVLKTVEETPTAVGTNVEDTPTEVADDSPAVTDGEVMTTESGLQYVMIVKGDGPAPKVGEVVSVHYRGMLEDGTEFDNSYDRGQPIAFTLGRGMVIPGWDEGIGLLNVGGQAKLIIPPELAYGASGAGGVIPPNATLIFEVELIDVQPGSPEAPQEVDDMDYETTDTGLKYHDLQEGDGPVAEAGQTVSVHYTGWVLDGAKFDSSLDRGKPFIFVLGQGQVISGWDEGVAGMKVGGKRQLVIPPELGYGESGAGEAIPPNATLVFDVELLEVQ